jgi:5-methyltetrahydropteroyltriglutamate--homocysteine methyltransferase
VIDVKSSRPESPEEVAERVRTGLQVVAPERLVVNPDCGLRHVPVAAARAKLHAMVDGTAMVRRELTG